MKISTRLYIGAAVPAVIVVILVTLVVIYSQVVTRETEKQNLALDLTTAVAELDIVEHEYLEQHEDRMEQQWYTRYDSIWETVQKEEYREVELVESIFADLTDRHDLFSNLTANAEERFTLIQEGAPHEKIDATALVEDRLAAQLHIKTQSIKSTITRFAADANLSALKAQGILRTLTIVSMIAFAVIVMTTSILVARSISVPLSKLAAYSGRIRDAEYNAEVEIQGKNEIANVASTVETMVERLLTIQGELRLEIAERKQREEDLRKAQDQLVRHEKLAVLGEMAGGVGHELRNPLAVMKNAIYYLNMIGADADEKVREYINIIGEEIKTADGIITDLLDFARVKSINKEVVSIAAAINLVLQKEPPPENVTSQINIADDLAPAFVDRRHLEQVLLNLTTNAYHAMPQGGELTITAKIAADQSNIAVNVSDNGVGISQENIGKIFEPLFTTKASGVGLGLAITKRLIEANGGSIQVESERGNGSVFNVILPTAERA